MLCILFSTLIRSILDTFKKDNPGEEADARAAFLAIDTRMRKGLLQIHSTSTLLIELIAFTINGFTGTRTSFLTTWYAKLRDLQMTLNPGQGLSFTFIRSMLSKSLQSDSDLAVGHRQVGVYSSQSAPL